MTGGTGADPYVQTVAGAVPAAGLGLVLPHEHLFNNLSGVLDKPSYPFSAALKDEQVSASSAWALRHDPYCCADNIAAKPVEDVHREVAAFQAVGGRTIVDVTSSSAIGRDPQRLLDLARRSGLNIVMGCGAYLEKFEATRNPAGTVDEQAAAIGNELTHGVGDSGIRPGVIGEIGVSPQFTAAEHGSLRAAALAQLDHPSVPLMIHLPGWQRRAHEVLDVVLGEIGVEPAKVVLAHMDPSGADVDYQRSVADRGVWLEFDMIGMDVTFPKEGESPASTATADAVARHINDGHARQLLLSHDLFLKQMWTQHGGNGLIHVPTVFAEMLVSRGINRDLIDTLTRQNPVRMLAGPSQRRHDRA
ncbi:MULTISPECIES: phosphotriesterase-related protein [unclassified Streptomyces]|uniref:phosphotriesterase family protein n=1 Tax=unclassified Streptomyces TaxID=2593676 RepID=UPI002E135BA0|nr:phosphotriesterase-related protein [Streptomyces sp. NBC_01197]WSS52805.1 phosphotriesterase-related protein [Streptomyces sp. NBC_01180]